MNFQALSHLQSASMLLRVPFPFGFDSSALTKPSPFKAIGLTKTFIVTSEF